MSKGNYTDYIGKCYIRDAECGNIAIYKITGIYNKGFLVTHYYINLGYSIKEMNLEMQFSMTAAPNFHEIPDGLFKIAEYIHSISGRYEFTNKTYEK